MALPRPRITSILGLLALVCLAQAVLSAQSTPIILPKGVGNSAGTGNGLAAGSIAAIYGSGFSTLAQGSGIQASTFPLPTILNGTQVLMNGILAPLFYVDSTQINAQVPWEVQGSATLAVQVIYNGIQSNTETLPLAASALGIFLVVHASDYSVVSTAKPATSGEYLVVFCTGLGPVTNPPATGSPSPGDTLSKAAPPTVTLGGVNAPVVFSGLTPGLVALYQVNIFVPQGIASGNAVPLVVTAADSSSTATIQIAFVATRTLSTFQLPELFGVAWPDQPIEFRYDGGAPAASNTRMLGPGGDEVPFQWVGSCSDSSATQGCIVVRASLPANSNNTWTLQSGKAPTASPVNAVRVAQTGSSLEITNGLTGVRIVSADANHGPWNLAPIQGIQLPGGAWTGVNNAPNLLYSESSAGCVGCALRTQMNSVTGYDVSVVESGPLKVVVKANYTFNRPKYAYGSTIINAAGPGHYTFIVTLYANSKSILIDEDSDMQFSYFVPVAAQLIPDVARYRGHDSLDSSGQSNAVCGYESPVNVTSATGGSPVVITPSAPASLSNGQQVVVSGVQGNEAINGGFFAKTTGYTGGQFALYMDAALTKPAAGNGGSGSGGTVKPSYRGQNQNPVADAFLDLTYSADRPPSYTCSATLYRKIVTNYPSADHSAGWYSMLYQANGGSSGPVVGFYTGRFSQQIHSANGPSMPGVYTSDKHWITGARAAGIQVDNLLRGPDGSVASLIHRNWALWVSTQADLRPPAAHQPIADDQNSLTGINLSRLYTYQLTYPDPLEGWKWQYLSSESANRIVAMVRNGTSTCGSVNCYYTLLKNSESSMWGGALLNMWQGNSTASVQTALNGAAQLAQKIVQTLATGDNRFDGPLGYYQLGLSTSPESAVLNAIIMDANATTAQRTSAKAMLALFGSLFWDNDWWPIENTSGASVGLANQIQQYLQYRAQAVAAAPTQPFLASMANAAIAYPINDFATYFSATGAAAGSTHYQSAFFEPLILNYLNFSLNGILSMSDPKWAAYANWELSIQTPPEPRFGNIRKGYSNGDGNTESDVRTGMLGTALYPVNPTLAGNLMWAWQQSNSPTVLTEDSQFVTTLAAIDPTIPAVTPQLGSINIPGYHTAERHNFGTPNETALWFINGGFYSPGGHRHADDGQVSIYAHAAPLAIDWNPNLYSPEVPGRFMHNSIVLDSERNASWSADNPSLFDASNLLKNPSNTDYGSFGNSTTSTGTFTTGDGTVWTRRVRLLNYNPGYPIIAVSDSFAGPSALAGKTLTWNLMASGAVGTPAGSITPTVRFSNGCQSPAGALPSNGTVSGLSPGLNQFNFTGVTWPKHATQGINWDLYSVTGGPNQQFMLGNWGHGCHDTRDASEYRAANGANFAETQHILRIHDTGSFTTLILPYRKTEAPNRTVTQQACGVQIQQGPETTCVSDSAATYANGGAGILTVFDDSSQTAFGITASGGPQEIVVQGSTIAWTVSGIQAGTRTLSLPGAWFPNTAVAQNGTTWSAPWQGGAQTAPATVTFSQRP